MLLTEILQGLKDCRFRQGEILESREGFWFQITMDGSLLGKVDGDVFEIGKLATPPTTGFNDPQSAH